MTRWIYRIAKYLLFLLAGLGLWLWQVHQTLLVNLLDAPLFHTLALLGAAICLLSIGCPLILAGTLVILITQKRPVPPLFLLWQRSSSATRPGEAISFPIAQGKQQGHGIYIEAKGSTQTLILTLDPADELVPFFVLAENLWREGYHVLLFTFSHLRQVAIAGEPEVEECRGAVAYAKTRAPGTQLGLYGYHRGASAALLSGACLPGITAVAADSSTSSAWNIAEKKLNKLLHKQKRFPLWFLRLIYIVTDLLLYWTNGYHLQQAAPSQAIPLLTPRPVLLLSTQENALSPASETRSLYQVANKPRALTLFTESKIDRVAGQEYLKALLRFFNQTLGYSSTFASQAAQPVSSPETKQQSVETYILPPEHQQTISLENGSSPTSSISLRKKLFRPIQTSYAALLYRWRWWLLGGFLALISTSISAPALSFRQDAIKMGIQLVTTFPEAFLLLAFLGIVVILSRSLPAALFTLLQALSTIILTQSTLHLIAPSLGANQLAQDILWLFTPTLAISSSQILISAMRKATALGWHGEQALFKFLFPAAKTLILTGCMVSLGFISLILNNQDAIGLTGLIGLLTTMYSSLIFFPAALCILGSSLDQLPLKRGTNPFLKRTIGHPIRRHTPTQPGGTYFWQKWAQSVTRRPWTVTIVIVAFLILIGWAGAAFSQNAPVIRPLDTDQWFTLLLVSTSAFILLFMTTRFLLLSIKAVLLALVSISAAASLTTFFCHLIGLSSQEPFQHILSLLFSGPLLGLVLGQESMFLLSLRSAHDRIPTSTESIVSGFHAYGNVLSQTIWLFSSVGILLFCLPSLGTKEIGISLCALVLIDQILLHSTLSLSLTQIIGKWCWWSPSFSSTAYTVALKQANTDATRHFSSVQSPEPSLLIHPPEQIARVEQTLMLLFSQALEIPLERIRETTHFFVAGNNDQQITTLLAGIHTFFHFALTLDDIKATPVLYRLALKLAKQMNEPESTRLVLSHREEKQQGNEYQSSPQQKQQHEEDQKRA